MPEPRVHFQRWCPSDMRGSRVRVRSIATGDHFLRLVYRELLDSLWEHGGVLPDDPEYLADDLGLPQAEVERVIPLLLKIRGALVRTEAGLSNPRISRDLAEEAAFRHQQSLKGSRGARARLQAEVREASARAKPVPGSGQPAAQPPLNSGRASAKQVPSSGSAAAQQVLSLPLSSSSPPTSPVKNSFFVPSSCSNPPADAPEDLDLAVEYIEGHVDLGEDEDQAQDHQESGLESPPGRDEEPASRGSASGPATPVEAKPRPPRGEARGVASAREDFAAWWALYPKKVGKGEAEAYWLSMPSAEREAALAAVVDFAAAWRGAAVSRMPYLIYPVRWLKRRHWTDDPAVWWQQAETTPPAPSPAQLRGLVGAHAPAPPPVRDPDDESAPAWVRSVMRHMRTDGAYTEEQFNAVMAWKAGQDVGDPAIPAIQLVNPEGGAQP